MGNVDYVPLHCTQNNIPGFDSPTRQRQPSRANTGVKPSGYIGALCRIEETADSQERFLAPEQILDLMSTS